MPGTYTFKPIEANLTHDISKITTMDPYCTFAVGNNKVHSHVSHNGGDHPQWSDSCTLPISNDLCVKVHVEIKDKNKLSHDDNIGDCEMDLYEVQENGQMSKWYPISHNNKYAGEVLIETIYEPDYTRSDGEGMIRRYSKQEEENMEHERELEEEKDLEDEEYEREEAEKAKFENQNQKYEELFPIPYKFDL